MKISNLGDNATINDKDYTIGQKMLVSVKDKQEKATLIELEYEDTTIQKITVQLQETLECIIVAPDDIAADIEIDFMIKASDGSNEIVEQENKLTEAMKEIIANEIIEVLQEDIDEAKQGSQDLYVRVYIPYEGGEADWTEVSILE